MIKGHAEYKPPHLHSMLLKYNGNEYWITKDAKDIYICTRGVNGSGAWRWFSCNNESWRKFVY